MMARSHVTILPYLISLEERATLSSLPKRLTSTSHPLFRSFRSQNLNQDRLLAMGEHTETSDNRREFVQRMILISDHHHVRALTPSTHVESSDESPHAAKLKASRQSTSRAILLSGS